MNEAKVAIQKSKWKGAIEGYRQALELKPDAKVAKTGLGIALVMSETGFKEAVPLLQDGVKTERANAQAWLALGMAFQNLGNDREAKGPYQKYLKLKPNGAMADEVRAALDQLK